MRAGNAPLTHRAANFISIEQARFLLRFHRNGSLAGIWQVILDCRPAFPIQRMRYSMISIFDMASGETARSEADDGEERARPPLFNEHAFASTLRLEPVHSYWSETRRKNPPAMIALELPRQVLRRAD